MATARTVAAPNKAGKGNVANLGFEEKLWAAADKMRGHMDPAEYKHVVLGLIFLKYISDAFTERHDRLLKEDGADPEESGRIPGGECVLGATGSAMDLSPSQCEAAG